MNKLIPSMAPLFLIFILSLPLYPQVLRFTAAAPFSGDGLAVAQQGERFGYLGTGGEWVIPPRFVSAERFSDGLAAVKLPGGGEYGFINIKGELVIQPKYLFVKNFSDGMAAVMEGERWGYINKAGGEVIKPAFKDAFNFSNGIARVKIFRENTVLGMTGFINKSGGFVIAPNLGSASSFVSGYAVAESRNRFGILNTRGAWVISPQYDSMGHLTGGLFPVYTGWKWGFADPGNRIVIEPQYEEAGPFSESLAKVRERGKDRWGYIDRKGGLVIPYDYDEAGDFTEGLARVKIADQGYGFINRQGLFVIKPAFLNVSDFHEGLALAETKSREMGFIDKSGNWIIGPRNWRLWHFSQGYAVVNMNGRWGYMNRKGEFPMEPGAEGIGLFPGLFFNPQIPVELRRHHRLPAMLQKKIPRLLHGEHLRRDVHPVGNAVERQAHDGDRVLHVPLVHQADVVPVGMVPGVDPAVEPRHGLQYRDPLQGKYDIVGIGVHGGPALLKVWKITAEALDLVAQPGEKLGHVLPAVNVESPRVPLHVNVDIVADGSGAPLFQLPFHEIL